MTQKNILIILALLFSVHTSFAQDISDPSNQRKLFASDKKGASDQKIQAQGKALSSDSAPEDQVQFLAPTIEHTKDKGVVKGKGGVLISGNGVQVQADEGTYNTETKDVEVYGNVIITSAQGAMNAQRAKFNLGDQKLGEFNDASFLVEQGSFNLQGRTIKKTSEDEYDLFDSVFSTCQCPDGSSSPWTIDSSHCHIKQEGLGQAYNSTLWMYGVPVVYTPYILFPVKTERSSGLLAPTYGYSNRDGFQLQQPLFIVLDEQKDLLATPFLEARTRRGSMLEYRQAVEDKSTLVLRGLFSDETPREDDLGVKSLRGVDTTGIFDPSIDSQRFGGLAKFNWNNDSDSSLPTSIVVDGRYASDNLLVREIDRSGIGNYTSTFLDSKAVVRNSIGDYVTTEIGTEYTQDLFGDQDYVLQRLPEISFNAEKSFRPLGTNPYGFKVATGIDGDYTAFQRAKGFDGSRTSFEPYVTVPLRYSNVLTSQLRASVVTHDYSLNNPTEIVPGQTAPASSSSSVAIPKFTYTLNSSVERVYTLDDDSSFKDIFGFGAKNQRNVLQRIKHTVEPVAIFNYIPDKNVEEQPNFEPSVDRLRERESVTYGVTSRLYGRFLPTTRSDDDIQELSVLPEDSQLPSAPSLLEAMSGGFIAAPSVDSSALKRGETRELMNASLLELYDRKYVDSLNTTPSPGFSDTLGVFNIYPADSVALGLGATYNRENSQVTSVGTGIRFTSDRGDAVKLRYSFKSDEINPDNRDKISQVELGTELVLSERVRLGYFGRYDDKDKEFVETQGAMRLLSECNCWSFDLGFSQRTNPDKDRILATFTFTGLGDVTQDLPILKQQQNSQQ